MVENEGSAVFQVRLHVEDPARSGERRKGRHPKTLEADVAVE
jgi:hypothetical protein